MLAGGAALAAEQEQGLLAHWDFSEGAGTELHDRSGNGRHGRIHGATWEQTPGNGALRFPGKDGYAECSRPPAFSPSGDLTLLAWVKPTADPFRNPGTNYVVLASQGYWQDGFVIRVEAEGEHYHIERTVSVFPHRIVVKDAIRSDATGVLAVQLILDGQTRVEIRPGG